MTLGLGAGGKVNKSEILNPQNGRRDGWRHKSELPKLKIQNTLQHQNTEVENGGAGGAQPDPDETTGSAEAGRRLGISRLETAR